LICPCSIDRRKRFHRRSPERPLARQRFWRSKHCGRVTWVGATGFA